MEQFDNKKMRDCPSLASHRGFTLVELLVSIFIIILMSGIIFANYRAGRQEFALQRSANKLAQDIRRAQEMTMSAKEYQPGMFPEGGYGIWMEPAPAPAYTHEYILFADIYEPDEHEYDPGNDYLVEQIKVEKGVMIKNPIQTEQGDQNEIHITFVPPDPEVHILPRGMAEPQWCKITLALEADTSKIKTIEVNTVGLVDID